MQFAGGENMEIKIQKIIKQKREEHQMLQEDLAKRLGVTPSAVSSWERGRTEPNMIMVDKMCNLFGCTYEELIYGKKLPQVDYTVTLSNEEKILIELYRKSDNDARFLAQSTLLNNIMKKDEDK